MYAESLDERRKCLTLLNRCPPLGDFAVERVSCASRVLRDGFATRHVHGEHGVDRVRNAWFSVCHSRLCFSGESADCVSTLESVCGKYGSLKEIKVSFTFDTIELGSLIVCGLLALPHDLVPNQTQVDVCCVCIVGAASARDSRSSPLASLPEMAFSLLV